MSSPLAVFLGKLGKGWGACTISFYEYPKKLWDLRKIFSNFWDWWLHGLLALQWWACIFIYPTAFVKLGICLFNLRTLLRWTWRPGLSVSILYVIISNYSWELLQDGPDDQCYKFYFLLLWFGDLLWMRFLFENLLDNGTNIIFYFVSFFFFKLLWN